MCATFILFYFIRLGEACLLREGCYSKKFDLVNRVPHGSCLGPLLFTVEASKLFQVIRAHLHDVHAYSGVPSYTRHYNLTDVDQHEAVQADLGMVRSFKNRVQINSCLK